MNYFANCKTQEELKKEYHRLAMKLHPDKGGDSKEFQEMQKQYENWSSSTSHHAIWQERVKQAKENMNTFYQQNSWGQQYKRHHINIPFDHPIRQEIEDLKKSKENLSKLYDMYFREWSESRLENNNLKKDLSHQIQETIEKTKRAMQYQSMYEDALTKNSNLAETAHLLLQDRELLHKKLNYYQSLSMWEIIKLRWRLWRGR